MKTKDTMHFEDTIVIYEDTDDSCWIAHSLRTDQVGIGDHIVPALADLIRAVEHVMEVAAKDETVMYLREAPPDIQKRAANAKSLPYELFEIAHKLVKGDWPKNWTPPEPKNRPKRPMKIEVPEFENADC